MKMPTPDKAAEVVARLEKKAADARQELAQAHEAYGAAVLAAEEDGAGRGDFAAVEKSRKALERAHIDLIAADTALGAARQRQGQAIAAAQADRIRDRWGETMRTAESRLPLARAVEKAVGELTIAIRRLQDSGVALDKACPVRLGAEVALSMPPTVMAVVRLHMAKAGLAWAAPLPFGSMQVPSLVERVESANAYLDQLRATGA